MKTNRIILSIAVLSAVVLAVPSAAVAHQRPSTYTNQLDLRMPDGSQAASCADPDIIRSQIRGDRNWYLYCTTDALSETRNVDGELDFHSIPIFRSTDLEHFSYVGDAFAGAPAWIGIDAGLWAPEIAYRDGRYLLYYTASDTAAGGSAIGVATSASPAGPWVDSGAPVVAPDASGRWQFDPEVLTAKGHSYLYFGSYFGGIHARELSADGLTSLPATETPIAIDNRYEATVIVKHGGWFYFMGSATNCCAGPLTGYSVFSARSRSPLGPFIDRDGASILDNRVGGTPVLSQNGNRWVGTGHNTVFTDFDGQDWTIYHAVDKTDPYYAGETGYTKRPALLDPLDWRNGWPTVRGGAGPSDRTMPAPAAQPHQHTAYSPRFERDAMPGKKLTRFSDSFAGTTLSNQWTWVRPDAATFQLTDGRLVWQTQAADLQPPAEPLASVLTEAAPRGDFMVEAKVSVSTGNDDSVQNYVQGGLVIYRDDANYVRLASASIWNTRQTEFGIHVTPQPGFPSYGNGVVGPVADSTYLRIVREGDLYTAYSSVDGHSWDKGGTWQAGLGSSARIGLVSMGGSGFTSSFDYVKVSRLRK